MQTHSNTADQSLLDDLVRILNHAATCADRQRTDPSRQGEDRKFTVTDEISLTMKADADNTTTQIFASGEKVFDVTVSGGNELWLFTFHPGAWQSSLIQVFRQDDLPNASASFPHLSHLSLLDYR